MKKILFLMCFLFLLSGNALAAEYTPTDEDRGGAPLIPLDTDIEGTSGTLNHDYYYKIEIPDSGYVNLVFQHDSGVAAYIGFVASNGKEIDTFGFSASDSSVYTSYKIGVHPGTYYVYVDTTHRGSKGNYTFRVNYTKAPFWEAEPNNNTNEANDIEVNQEYNAITDHSTDVYKFTLTKKTNVSIDVQHLQGSGDYFSMEIELRDGTNTKLKTIYSKPSYIGVVTMGPLELEAGTYYLYIEADNRGFNCTPYNFRVNVQDSGIVSTDESVGVYRLYNPSSLEHLYTTDQNEVAALSSGSWKNEGVAWYAPVKGDGVYRLYSSATGSHLYTKDLNEVNTLKKLSIWSVDNSGKPLLYSGGSKPIYRLYNPTTKMHLLTTDLNEYNALGSAGWNQEGIALYANN